MYVLKKLQIHMKNVFGIIVYLEFDTISFYSFVHGFQILTILYLLIETKWIGLSLVDEIATEKILLFKYAVKFESGILVCLHVV